METKRKALGKGLEQLFSNERIDFDNFEKEIVKTTKTNEVIEIPLDEIRSNPYQPRKTFDQDALQDMANSIKEHGVVQPIIVKKSIKGYELVAGERRTKAARIAGLDKIPAIIKEFNDIEMMEIAIIENIQRENLNPIEEAEAYEKIIKFENLTQEALAVKFGKSRSHITNLLGLLRLPKEVKELLANHTLSMGHARVLSKLADENQIINLANKIKSENLSVRDLEQISTDKHIPRVNTIKKHNYNLKTSIYEKHLCEHVGAKVKISPKKIEIPYVNDKDLERILEIIGLELDGE